MGLGLGLAVLGLGACNEVGENHAQANRAICVDFKQAKAAPGLAPADGAGVVDECVRRWSYSLAASRDEADVVADAVVAACGVQLSRWNQQTVNQHSGADDAVSITTGQPTTPLTERYAFTRNRALLYVVQARAGGCSPPPAANGAPEGVG